MNQELRDLCQELTRIIQDAYEGGITVQEAEKLAGRFLHAQLIVAESLHRSDLDTRMRKSGLKALKAGLYMEEVSKSDKKPSDTLLNNIVDSHDQTKLAQGEFDAREADKEALEVYLSVFKEAHIFFRGIAKGSFGG